MKYGIDYAYWEKGRGGQFVPYVKKRKAPSFDVLEVACGAFHLARPVSQRHRSAAGSRRLRGLPAACPGITRFPQEHRTGTRFGVFA